MNHTNPTQRSTGVCHGDGWQRKKSASSGQIGRVPGRARFDSPVSEQTSIHSVINNAAYFPSLRAKRSNLGCIMALHGSEIAASG